MSIERSRRTAKSAAYIPTQAHSTWEKVRVRVGVRVRVRVGVRVSKIRTVIFDSGIGPDLANDSDWFSFE